jgi:heme-degrading monooxygenase HmoA
VFARNVLFRLRPDVLCKFSAAFEESVMPMLRQQKGFQDEIVLALPGGMDVIAISVWDTQEDGEIWSLSRYHEVISVLGEFLRAEPRGRTLAVLHHSGKCVLL